MTKVPPKYTSPTGMWVTKLILRILSIIFCIAIFGLSGSLSSIGYVDILVLVVATPPVGIAICWDIAEGICILARGGHRGIHPGACVGMDLIIWLGLIASDTLLGFLGLSTDLNNILRCRSSYSSSYYYDSYSYYYNCGSLSRLDREEVLGKGKAIVGLLAVLIIIHFTLFVIACYETNVRNRLPKQTIIVVQNPNGGPPTAMYPGQQPVYYQMPPGGGGPGQQQQQQPYYHMPPSQMAQHPHQVPTPPPAAYTQSKPGAGSELNV
ncbi:hypothetical protein B0H63DRAFT_462628 [Podospora didyma]|uniref:MARVEL domain-containing protein n=1 Tax=Podospora didyma TaxID=330526 RepID=A0AAE0P851_9PEZI|nr:hypothetical protein B0H63DRAFT_462628 [Podospora didyma]